MAKVFLSYTHKDADAAARVEQAITQAGHRVWRDINRDELAPGQFIPSAVAVGLEQCDYLVIVVTKNALSSRWMKQELNNFLMDNAKWDKVLPVRLDETNPHDFHGLLRAVVFADCRDFKKGMDGLLRRLGPPTDRDDFPEEDHERLHFAIDLALRAGNVAMRFYNSSLLGNATLDDRKNAATNADLAAQLEIASAILNHSRFKKDVFVAEESPHNKTKPTKIGFTWVADPLDGTTNFQNRIPLFCTAIAVLKDGRPYIGVIYAPVSHELYYAVEGSPAKVWDVSRGDVAVISADQTVEKLRDCVVGAHISSRPEVAERLLGGGVLLNVATKVKHVRALGCGQLALAYVASGRLHAFFQFGSYLWDQAAGIVLVNNSNGGVVTKLPTGTPWSYTTTDFIASANPVVHRHLLAELSRTCAGKSLQVSAG